MPPLRGSTGALRYSNCCQEKGLSSFSQSSQIPFNPLPHPLSTPGQGTATPPLLTLMDDDVFSGVDTVRMESRTAEYRKVVKPLLEKRRRARMNSSLNELKAFIVDAKKAEISDPSKLEKADILELTVRHLRELRRQQRALSSAMTAGVEASRFCAGFIECAQEVGVYVAALPGMDGGLKSRLLSHLSRCMSQADRLHPNHVIHTNNPQIVSAPVPLHPGTSVGFPTLNSTYSPPSTSNRSHQTSSFHWGSSSIADCSPRPLLKTEMSPNDSVSEIHPHLTASTSEKLPPSPPPTRDQTIASDNRPLVNFQLESNLKMTRSSSPVWRPW